MKVFISHNKADEPSARALAVLLIEQGVGVWFDEWEIGVGQSIVGGIEQGLGNSNVFMLLWSEQAQRSKWVGTELHAFLRRRVENDGLKIVPLMLDATPLPVLVADYRGFDLSSGTSLGQVVAALTGHPRNIEVAVLLQQKLIELMSNASDPRDPLPYLVCPCCASPDLKRSGFTNPRNGDAHYEIKCQCGWGEAA